jgi:hypothetical protein
MTIPSEDVMNHLRLRAELGVKAYNLARAPHATESARRIFELLWLFYSPLPVLTQRGS